MWRVDPLVVCVLNVLISCWCFSWWRQKLLLILTLVESKALNNSVLILCFRCTNRVSERYVQASKWKSHWKIQKNVVTLNRLWHRTGSSANTGTVYVHRSIHPFAVDGFFLSLQKKTRSYNHFASHLTSLCGSVYHNTFFVNVFRTILIAEGFHEKLPFFLSCTSWIHKSCSMLHV